MSDKENKVNPEISQPKHETKKVKPYTEENRKATMKLNEAHTEIRHPRGKKQRRQFKLAPNRK